MNSYQTATPVPTESVEQQRLFQWARMASGAHPELRLMYKIPNEGKRSVVAGAMLKRAGMRPGFPDLFLPRPRGKYHGLFIEMKYDRGKTSKDQEEWISLLRGEGYACAVCYNASEAIEIIEKYNKGDRK